MKLSLSYGAYFLIAATVTYVVEFISSFMISGILFNAADAPPGDLSDTGKLLLSVGMPAIIAVVLFAFYYVYSTFLKLFEIHLMLSVGVIFHIMIAIYLIWHAVPDAF